MTRRILLDTDIGTDADDAVALALALASPELELIGIVVTGKHATLRARIAAKLCVLAGRADIPIHVGATEPAGRGSFYWVGHEGDGIVTATETLALAGSDGVSAYDTITRDGGVDVVVIGTLTTLAAALDRYPDLAERIPRLVVMGGHVRAGRYGGAELPFGLDYNLCADGTAAARVLASGIPTWLVPIEVTWQAWLDRADLARLDGGGPLQQAIAAGLRGWAPVQAAVATGIGCATLDNVDFLHDPLTVACAHDDSFCTWEEIPIRVARVNGVFRTLEFAGATPVRVAVSVDADRIHNHVMERIMKSDSGDGALALLIHQRTDKPAGARG
jgi:purine nucleosidase